MAVIGRDFNNFLNSCPRLATWWNFCNHFSEKQRKSRRLWGVNSEEVGGGVHQLVAANKSPEYGRDYYSNEQKKKDSTMLLST